jgi:hypothetical protein
MDNPKCPKCGKESTPYHNMLTGELKGYDCVQCNITDIEKYVEPCCSLDGCDTDFVRNIVVHDGNYIRTVSFLTPDLVVDYFNEIYINRNDDDSIKDIDFYKYNDVGYVKSAYMVSIPDYTQFDPKKHLAYRNNNSIVYYIEDIAKIVVIA